MSDEFEDRLRKALRPVDPEEGFAERVMSRIDSAPASASASASAPALMPARRRWLPPRFRGLPAALAASALLGVVLIYAWQVDRERRGLEARRQLLEALHITGEKLDVAYRGVRRESSPPGNESGA
jgi:hypothetical protein